MNALREGKLVAGRHVANMIADHLRSNDSMAMVYSLIDIIAIAWKGDTPGQVSQFIAYWGNVLGNIDPSVDIGDKALQTILDEQMEQSLALDSEVKRFLRALVDRS